LWLEESVVPEELREFADAPGFKIAIFDIDVSYDTWQSPRTLSYFYIAVLDLLGKHPVWKALLKFKFANVQHLNTLPDGRRIYERVMRLIQERRIYVSPLTLSPITAGRLTNLCFCYSLNSAGICAQLRDSHAVHWDPVGVRYPLLQEEGQKIIFSSLEEAIQAIEQYASGDKRVGDLSQWLTHFDYFGDTKAVKRISDFIQNYMDAAVKEPELSGQLLSDKIAEQYLLQNGVAKEFYKPFTFWREEFRSS
jgi:hypothetical protein